MRYITNSKTEKRKIENCAKKVIFNYSCKVALSELNMQRISLL